MKLILVRHAEAVVLGEGGIVTDYDRPLTERGTTQAFGLAKTLTRLQVLPGLVLTSPLVRAVQTAEPIAAALTPGTPAFVNDYLRLEELRPRKLAKAIMESGHTSAVLVGHMPDLARLAGWLLGAGPTTIAFDKGAAAMIACGKTIEKGCGELRWLITPDWFLRATSP
jgi:phosphohistidine phosphatase